MAYCIKRMIVCIVIALSVIATGRASAFESLLQETRWRHFDDEGDIPSLYINDICFSIGGRLFIATDDVVAEHDGSALLVKTIDVLPEGVRYNVMLLGVDGALWVGTTNGLARLVGQEWHQMLPGGNVTSISESADGSIWIAVSPPAPQHPDDDGRFVGIHRRQQGTWTHFNDDDALPDTPVRTLYGDQDGGVWVFFGGESRTDHLYCYKDGMWRDMIAEMSPPPGVLLTMAQTRDGAYWFGTYGRGIWRWANGEWETFTGQPVETFTAVSLLPMPDGVLWAAGEPAGTIWSHTDQGWISHNVSNVGVTGRRVSRMIYSIDDAFWLVIPGHGLARFDRRGGPWWTYENRLGLPADAGVSLIRPGIGDEMWFGTTTGLVRYHNGSFNSPPVVPNVTDLPITAILPWPNGDIWVSSGTPVSKPGIWRFDGSEWTHVTTVPVVDNAAAVLAMLRSRDGDVWIGTAERLGQDGYGVFRRHDGHWTQYGVDDGLPSSIVLALAQDGEGSVWVGTPEGPAWFDGTKWHSFDHGDGPGIVYASSVFAATDSSVWVAGNVPDSGVSRYKNRRWVHYSSADGLPSDDVWSITEGLDKSIWVGTTRGVAQFDGRMWRTFSSENGLAKDHVWGSALGANGALWFGHFDGAISRYHATDNRSPRTFLEPLPENIAYPGFVTIRWRGRDWWDRTSREHLLYKWRVDNGTWSPLRDSRIHTFERISSGSHVFEVAAVDQEGNVDRIGATALLDIQTAYWANPWFIGPIVMAVAAVILLGGIAWKRNRQLRRARAQLMGEMQRELMVAQRLQASLLPQNDPIMPGLDITGVCLPASQVGGDYFTYLWTDTDSNRIGVVVADVTGHAMQAAIPAVLFSGMLATAAGQVHHPREILSVLNESLRERIDSHTFICCTVAVFDLSKRRFYLANAGGLDPVWRSGGTVKTVEVAGNRLPLGFHIDRGYNDLELPLQDGEAFVFVTDGIVEARSSDGELFGFTRLQNSISSGDTAQEIRASVLDAVSQHVGANEPDDDITLLVVRIGESPDES
jgi:serine phosphatase RsbU (regulator of sigma subunit)/ligand-binding sensor domain-containing protein